MERDMRPCRLAILALSGCGVGHEPRVFILSPEDGATFAAGDLVGMVGEVLDEDGDLDRVTWTSSLDGPLGDALPDAGGRVSATAELSAGAHVLSLEAIDLDGGSDRAEVSVSVGGWPIATIHAPAHGARFEVGAAVSFEGEISDPEQAARELTVSWQVRPTGGSLATVSAAPTEASGRTTATWTAELGTWGVVLVVRDADDHETTAEVTVEVVSVTALDADGDGYSIEEGDCDDASDAVHPGAIESCDGVDQDCDLLVDDKDADGDGHVDATCARYTGTAPRDDCNDNDDTVYPNAPEDKDATDDDCDGEIDEGTTAYDNDGDCYCVDAVCVDSIDPGCASPQGLDCDDGRATRHPGAPDDPDLLFDETNCDGIDGDVSRSVFLSASGNDGFDCLTPATACVSLPRALGVADANHRLDVLVQAGTYVGSIDADAGLRIYGGYDASWVRGRHTAHEQYLSRITGVAADTADPAGWATVRARGALTLQDLVLVGPTAVAHHGLAGAGSFGVYADGGGAVVLELVTIVRGTGAGGLTGAAGAAWVGPRAPDGLPGTPSATGACGTPPAGGGYGTQSCTGGTVSVRGGTGGAGGCPGGPGLDGGDAATVVPQRGHGGDGGAACFGATPDDGQVGVASNGLGGPAGAGGAWSSGRWIGGTGGVGALGDHGGGGGGGGGSGGCTTGSTRRGAGGGGGGSGGCRSVSPGQGGGPGGASVGVYAAGGSVRLSEVRITGGRGGTGGTGGDGGTGQAGGLGGAGGTSTSTHPGASGGAGARGGNAGGGGGGAGGPVFGVVTVGATRTGTPVFEAGTPGGGGTGGSWNQNESAGQTGTTGAEVDLVEL